MKKNSKNLSMNWHKDLLKIKRIDVLAYHVTVINEEI